ncbi:MAG: ABC transporter permease [Rhodomicrobium sp.]
MTVTELSGEDVEGRAGAEQPAASTAGQPACSSKVSLSNLLIGLALPVALALLWEAAVRLGLVTGRLMPPPSKIVSTLAALAQSGELWLHASATLSRVLGGFAIGAAAGTVLGALTGSSDLGRRLLDPMLQALRAVPSIAWVPLFILWLGIFEASKLALIALGVFFPIYLGVEGAVRSVDRKLIEVGRSFRLSRFGMISRILLPAVLPAWVVSLRSGLGLGFMFVVAAEFMGASEGLGYLLVDGQQLGKADQILAAIVAFALLGKAADSVLILVTKPFIAWQDVSRTRL